MNMMVVPHPAVLGRLADTSKVPVCGTHCLNCTLTLLRLEDRVLVKDDMDNTQAFETGRRRHVFTDDDASAWRSAGEWEHCLSLWYLYYYAFQACGYFEPFVATSRFPSLTAIVIRNTAAMLKAGIDG